MPSQILDVEQIIDRTHEHFSGSATTALPYETEEGKKEYEELKKLQAEREALKVESNQLEDLDNDEVVDFDEGSDMADDSDASSNSSGEEI